MNLENLKTVKSIAHEYNYSQVYLYRLIKKGAIKVVTIDGVMFIDTEALPADFKKK